MAEKVSRSDLEKMKEAFSRIYPKHAVVLQFPIKELCKTKRAFYSFEWVGFKSGYQEGYKQGLRDAKVIIEEEVAKIAKQLELKRIE